MIRIILIDDMAQVRQGLRTVLTLAAELANVQIEVLAEGSNGAEAIQLAKTLNPHVIVMDLEMPVVDGLTAARTIRACAPGIRLVALTVHDNQSIEQVALAAGFDVFLVKGAPAEALLAAITGSFPQTANSVHPNF